MASSNTADHFSHGDHAFPDWRRWGAGVSPARAFAAVVIFAVGMAVGAVAERQSAADAGEAETAAAAGPRTVSPAVPLVVNVNRANVRSGPSLSDEVIAKLNEGAEVMLVGHDGEWFNVEWTDGPVDGGWVHWSLFSPAVEPLPEGRRR